MPENKTVTWTILGGAAAAGLLALSGAARAQIPPATSGSSAPIVTVQADYHPSMGDLMTMAIQPRHTKLGLAGREGNWVYAQYELSELRNAFARVARTLPTYRTTDTTALIAALTVEPLANVEQAVHAADSHKFKAAYAQLTSACNACHLSQDHASVVIRIPTRDTYPDQDFHRPVR